MDVGFVLVATTRTGDLAALARRAEAAGFDSLWIPPKMVSPTYFHRQWCAVGA